MSAISLLITVSIHLLTLNGCATGKITHFTSISACHNEREPLWTMPNINNRMQYSKAKNNDNELQRMFVTQNGIVFSLSPLADLAGKRLQMDLQSVDALTGMVDQHKLLLQIIHPGQDSEIGCTRSPARRRVRRAVTDLSIVKEVKETVVEVNLDYVSAGVVDSPLNRFYLVDGDETTDFTRADLTTGKLLVNANRPLDYETADLHQYRLTVFVNNTGSSEGECPLLQ